MENLPNVGGACISAAAGAPTNLSSVVGMAGEGQPARDQPKKASSTVQCGARKRVRGHDGNAT
jgi:hypothetical protein